MFLLPYLLQVKKVLIPVGGSFDSFNLITACSVVKPLFKWLIHSPCIRYRECFRSEIYHRKHHTRDLLYSAFCWGDQTIRWGRIFLSMKF